jgi:citrate synthase
LALADPDRFGAPKEAEWERARRLVRGAAAVVALGIGEDAAVRSLDAETVAEATAVAIGAPVRRARRALDAVLVLTADHELNASTFAARVVASTGADLYACITAGLAALSGPLHGAMSDRVEALIEEAKTPERAAAAVQARTSRGETIPGFGHPLYPGGDPRVPPLLEAARELAGDSDRLATAHAVAAAMHRARREPPNLDFGLVAVVRALGLRRGSASALFAIGRLAGWIAHAIEQREAGFLLRPRAQYVGPDPSGS